MLGEGILGFLIVAAAKSLEILLQESVTSS